MNPGNVSCVQWIVTTICDHLAPRELVTFEIFSAAADAATRQVLGQRPDDTPALVYAASAAIEHVNRHIRITTVYRNAQSWLDTGEPSMAEVRRALTAAAEHTYGLELLPDIDTTALQNV